MQDLVVTCAVADRWYDAQATPGDIPDAVLTHIAGCARCRGTLVVTLVGGLNVPLQLPSGDGGCARCQDDLAAALDLARAAGAAVSAQTYPQVWWHRLVCPACAETFRLVALITDGQGP